MPEDSVPILRPARVCGAGVNVGATPPAGSAASLRERSRPSGTIPLELTRRSTPPAGWVRRQPKEGEMRSVIVDAPSASLEPVPVQAPALDAFKIVLIALNVIEAVVLALLLTR